MLQDLKVTLEKAIEFEVVRDRTAPFPVPEERVMDSKRVSMAVRSMTFKSGLEVPIVRFLKEQELRVVEQPAGEEIP